MSAPEGPYVKKKIEEAEPVHIEPVRHSAARPPVGSVWRHRRLLHHRIVVRESLPDDEPNTARVFNEWTQSEAPLPIALIETECDRIDSPKP